MFYFQWLELDLGKNNYVSGRKDLQWASGLSKEV